MRSTELAELLSEIKTSLQCLDSARGEAVLKAFILIAKYGVDIDEPLHSDLSVMYTDVARVKNDDVTGYLYQILEGDHCAKALDEMKGIGLLTLLLPELQGCFDVKFGESGTPGYSWWEIIMNNIEEIAIDKRLSLLLSGLGLNHANGDVPSDEVVREFYLDSIMHRYSLNGSISHKTISSYNREYFEERSVVSEKRPLLIMIGGGEMYDSYDEYIQDLQQKPLFHKVKVGNWRRWLAKKFTPDFEVVEIPMPNRDNATYREWCIQFEKFPIPSDRPLHLLGHSLGGIFLAKYISEKEDVVSFDTIHLVSAPFDSHHDAGGFGIPDDISALNSSRTFVYHAKNDEIVDYSEFLKYRESLPNAHICPIEDGGLKGHMIQPTFPEIYNNLRNTETDVDR